MARQKDAPQVPPKSTSKNETAVFVKYYLITYNILSTLGWTYVLIRTLVHVFNIDGNTSTLPPASTQTASSTLSRFLSSIPFVKTSGYVSTPAIEYRIPSFLQPVYRRAATTFARVGTQTAFVQTFAVLEVLHVLSGWVRSPLKTTAMQISSRLFLVWGIAEQFDVARVNPFYASMIVAWSATEVIRYAFYSCSLLGYEPRFLLYLRYTTFYVLYPLGASSEAFLIYATLPPSSPIPSWQSWIQGMWKPTDYIRAGLFAIWWPGFYVLYTHMIAQRRKVLGSDTSRKLTISKGPKAN